MSATSHKNPLLEVNPSSCLFVLGPAATGSKKCRELVESALRFLQTTKQIASQSKRKLIAEIRKAEKHDLLGNALQAAVNAMQKVGRFSEWLQAVYEQTSSTHPTLEESLQQQLLELHKQGALLACTQLDSLPGTRQATLHDEESFENWLSSASGEDEYVNVETEDNAILLHLCGIYSQPDTIHTRDQESTQGSMHALIMKESGTMSKLKELMQEKLTIFIGFQDETRNPFLLNFLDQVYSNTEQEVWKHPPVIISSQKHRSQRGAPTEYDVFSHFLTLEVEEKGVNSVGSLISSGAKSNFSVARGLTDKQADGTNFQAFLLFNEKQSFRKLGEIIYHQSRSGEIYVRRDARSVLFDSGKILYSNIITYGGNGLRQLWRLVFADGSTLLGKGLVAFGLQNSAVVWIKGRPPGLGNVTDVNPTYAKNSHTASHQSMKISTKARPSETIPTMSLPATTTPVQTLATMLNSPKQSPVTGCSSPYPNGEILPPIIDGPPPPKLIKIPTTATEDSVSSTHKHATRELTAEDGGGKSHTVVGSENGLQLESSDAKYMQAIMKLQERINHHIAYSERLDTPSSSTQSSPTYSSSPSFRPPQFCVAGSSELLLDIIGRTRYVRNHEVTIKQIENKYWQQQSSLKRIAALAARKLGMKPSVPDLIPHTAGSSSRVDPPALTSDKHMEEKRDLYKRKTPTASHRPPQVVSPFKSQAFSPPKARQPSPTCVADIEVIPNQAAIPKVVMAAPSMSNYCVAVNPFPIILPAVPVMQQIPAGVPFAPNGNQMVCYMAPNPLINPMIPQEPQTANSPHHTSNPTPTKKSLDSPRRKNGYSQVHSSTEYQPPRKRPRLDSITEGQGSDVGSASERLQPAADGDKERMMEGNTSPHSAGPHSTLTSDGSVQLWIFLLDLLLSSSYRHIIHWTGNKYEFRIAQPAGLAKLWGTHRNKPQMTYEKMSRALRYYYSRGIIESVRGRKQTFKFSLDLQQYVSSNKDEKTLQYLRSCCHV